MDGRAHPQDLDPSWWGHSIGKVGRRQALVVDTVGFNDQGAGLAGGAVARSDALHVVERYRPRGPRHLAVGADHRRPKDYTKSWSVTNTYKLKPWDIGEEICTISSEKTSSRHSQARQRAHPASSLTNLFNSR